jgi:hypothetical protein
MGFWVPEDYDLEGGYNSASPHGRYTHMGSVNYLRDCHPYMAASGTVSPPRVRVTNSKQGPMCCPW